MGYTHYWEGRAKATPEILDAISAVIAKSGVPIRGGFGKGEPEVNADRIWLNGDESTDDDYETFLVNFDDPEWTFCKTARRPYDTVVVAILTLLAEANPDTFSWSSDGDAEDHAAGVELAFTAAGWL